VLLSFLKIRVVVNNRDIYPLPGNEPVVIPVNDSEIKIVVTDGFHFTKPLNLVYTEPSYYNFNVVCAVNDLQLFGSFLLLILCYLLGFVTGFFWMKLISFAPLLYLLLVYYLNRKEFIQVAAA
jgi:hypothetical protein